MGCKTKVNTHSDLKPLKAIGTCVLTLFCFVLEIADKKHIYRAIRVWTSEGKCLF